MYGSVTVRHILDGLHVYRCIEAHTVTLISVFSLYLQMIFSNEERVKQSKHLNQAINSCAPYKDGEKESEAFRSKVIDMQQALNTSGVYTRLSEWNENGKDIQRFIKKF